MSAVIQELRQKELLNGKYRLTRFILAVRLMSCFGMKKIKWFNPGRKNVLVIFKKLGFGEDDLPGLIKLAVNRGRFIGAEWCQQNPDGPWAACDSYSVIRREWIDAAYKEMDMEYYIKFAIGKSGRILLLVSCHPSEDRR